MNLKLWQVQVLLILYPSNISTISKPCFGFSCRGVFGFYMEYIFKYKDEVDGNFAFIIHTDEIKAREVLEEETSLRFLLVATKKLEDIPSALEHWENGLGNIYINQIMIF